MSWYAYVGCTKLGCPMKIVIGGRGEAPSALEQMYCVMIEPAQACVHWLFHDTAPSGRLSGNQRAKMKLTLARTKPLKAMKAGINEMAESATDRGDFSSLGMNAKVLRNARAELKRSLRGDDNVDKSLTVLQARWRAEAVKAGRACQLKHATSSCHDILPCHATLHVSDPRSLVYSQLKHVTHPPTTSCHVILHVLDPRSLVYSELNNATSSCHDITSRFRPSFPSLFS